MGGYDQYPEVQDGNTGRGAIYSTSTASEMAAAIREYLHKITAEASPATTPKARVSNSFSMTRSIWCRTASDSERELPAQHDGGILRFQQLPFDRRDGRYSPYLNMNYIF